MPHAHQAQSLKDQLLQRIPRHGYKDGIRVDKERYQLIMMCTFRPAYTKDEICEAVNQLWSTGRVPVKEVGPTTPVVSEKSPKAKKKELAALALAAEKRKNDLAALAQAAEKRKNDLAALALAAEKQKKDLAALALAAQKQRAAQAATAAAAAPPPPIPARPQWENAPPQPTVPTVKAQSAPQQHRDAIADLEASWGGSNDTGDYDWVKSADTMPQNGNDWQMPEAPRVTRQRHASPPPMRTSWRARTAPRNAPPPANIPIETSNHIDFTAARNKNVDELFRADHHIPLESESAPQVPGIPLLGDQMSLLSLEAGPAELAENDIKSSVLLSADSLTSNLPLVPQYALIGANLEPTRNANDPRLFVNTNHPFSAFICGLQGSGKSHSTSCLIENCLIESRTLGYLRKPLEALVFHFSEYTSSEAFRPCEAAFIAHADPAFKNIHRNVPVTVFVSRTNFRNLQQSYGQIPGVTVKALLLRPKDLNIASLLTLMSVDKTDSVPLYLAQITKVIRDMAVRSPVFDYYAFKREVNKLKLTPMQQQPLQMRLDLLESFLDLSGDESNTGFGFDSGAITIVDLSCPFVDSSTACVLFNIVLGVFLAHGSSAGKVIAVDEAHKYITNTPASKILTESLISVIRLQRHFGARIIIATQEPTIDTRLMDLCSMTLIHRFTSPDWFNVLKKHLSVNTDVDGDMVLYNRIMGLRVGEALMFAPSAVVGSARLGGDSLKLKVRKRITWDGGKSILSV